MQERAWWPAEAAHAAAPGALVDLGEFAGPADVDAALLALATAPGADAVVPVLARDPAAPAWRLVSAARPALVALDGARDPAEVAALVDRLVALSPGTRVVLRLRDGGALHHAEALGRAAGGRLAGIWYAAADLVVDHAGEDARAPWFVDAPFPRLAAPGWTRSRCLVIARALGVALWGQLDLGFLGGPAPGAERALRRARAEGFDVVVRRGGTGVNAAATAP